MVTILNNLHCPQGSEAWEAERRGKATASAINKILTPAGLRPSKSARRYAIDCACELQGIATPTQPPTFAMERGLEMEPLAAEHYEASQASIIHHVGFVYPDDSHRVDGVFGWGCSPDRLIGDDGILEIKCPLEVETVVEYADDAVVPLKYKLQCQFQLWVCDRDWLDFMAFHPDYVFQIRCFPDAACFDAFAKYLPLFHAEVKRFSQLISANKLDIQTGTVMA